MDDRNMFGLAGIGVCGEFSVEILDARDDRWLLTIDSRTWWFAFSLSEFEVVRRLAGFLRSRRGRNDFAEIVVGSFGGAVVRVVKDDEFADRFFLESSNRGAGVGFTLVGEASEELANALSEAAVNLAPTPDTVDDCDGDRGSAGARS